MLLRWQRRKTGSGFSFLSSRWPSSWKSLWSWITQKVVVLTFKGKWENILFSEIIKLNFEGCSLLLGRESAGQSNFPNWLSLKPSTTAEEECRERAVSCFYGFSFFQGVPGSWKLLTQWRPHLSKPLQKQRNHSLILHIKMIGMVCEYDDVKKVFWGK